MLRMKYKLYNGTTPHDAIVSAVPSINQFTDLALGQFPNGDWIYGDIDTDPENKSTLEAALANWSIYFFLDDAAAKTYIDDIIPESTVIQYKLTWDAASIDGETGYLKKTYTEHVE